MRILLLTHNLAGLGGSYMRAFSLARQLAGFGHEVSLLASRHDNGARPRVTIRDGVQVVEMPDLAPARWKHGGLSLLDCLARMAWVRRRSFDVVHAFDHRPAVSMPALMGKQQGALLVSDWADLWGSDGIGGERTGAAGRLLAAVDDVWEPRFRRAVHGVTVITRDLWDRVGEVGVPDARRWLLPPGANVDLIRPLRKDESRRYFNLPDAAHVVVSTGYAPYDERLLADSMLEVLAADPEAWAVTSGGQSEVLRRVAGERSFEARLRMLGTVPLEDLERVLACADVLLLPCSDRPVNRARFPNRFGDFLAAGRPIVTNRTGDLGEMVSQHEIGVLADDDPVDMARKVVGLFQDVRAAEELGRRARAFAENDLSWESLARGVEGFYGRLVGIGSPSTSTSR